MYVLAMVMTFLACMKPVDANEDSLRQRIMNAMFETVNSGEQTSEEGANLLSVSEQAEIETEEEVEDEFVQVNFDEFLSHDDTFLQLASRGKMSFDCWSHTQDTCESQYCVWTHDRCTISPSAYALLCDFYCEESICVPPANVTSEEKCVPTAEAFAGLCTAIKSKQNCALQGDLCSTTPKGQCVDACCSKARAFCRKNKKQGSLASVMQACGSYTTKDKVCQYAKTHCAVKKP